MEEKVQDLVLLYHKIQNGLHHVFGGKSMLPGREEKIFLSAFPENDIVNSNYNRYHQVPCTKIVISAITGISRILVIARVSAMFCNFLHPCSPYTHSYYQDWSTAGKCASVFFLARVPSH
jgi:hypothetical protein